MIIHAVMLLSAVRITLWLNSKEGGPLPAAPVIFLPLMPEAGRQRPAQIPSFTYQKPDRSFLLSGFFSRHADEFSHGYVRPCCLT